MINKNNIYWKEAIESDKMRQQMGFTPLSESDLLLTAQHFERCNKEAMAAMARNIATRKERGVTDEEIFG